MGMKIEEAYNAALIGWMQALNAGKQRGGISDRALRVAKNYDHARDGAGLMLTEVVEACAAQIQALANFRDMGEGLPTAAAPADRTEALFRPLPKSVNE
jgi:hypothetical protein